MATVEGWNVFKDDRNLVCVMERVVDNGYLVRMGKKMQGTDFGYIAVYTKDNSVNIFVNVTRDVVFDIDGERFSDKGWRISRRLGRRRVAVEWPGTRRASGQTLRPDARAGF